MTGNREPNALAAFLDEASPEDVYLSPLVTRSLRLGQQDVFAVGCGAAAFSHIDIIRRGSDGIGEELLFFTRDFMGGLPALSAPLYDHLSHRLSLIALQRPAWAGFRLDRPLVMGIVNATPDSFSDGGFFLRHDKAIDQGRALTAAGADIVDVGGESTRPGAMPVDDAEEARRVLPVVAALAEDGITVSIDTRNTAVMRAALDAGARIVNDVSALADPAAAALVIERQTPVVLMHMQGEPPTMQVAPTYRDVTLDVFDFLNRRVLMLEALGLSRNRIILDPGIGFGKTLQHNVALLRRLGMFLGIGCGLLIGASRKGFIAKLAQDQSSASERLGGSLALAVEAVAQGANVIRVHDVAETVQALRVFEAIKRL